MKATNKVRRYLNRMKMRKNTCRMKDFVKRTNETNCVIEMLKDTGVKSEREREKDKERR